MELVLIFVGIVVAVFLIVGYLALCSKFAKIGKSKGMDKTEAFLFCLLFSVMGAIYVICYNPNNKE